MKPISQISVFFPAYNEVSNIKNTVTSATQILDKLAGKYEIIVVDDGSTDGTAELVKSLTEKNPQIRLVTHHPNQGYGAAIKTGLIESKYSLICYTDSDGQFSFSEINKFIEQIDAGADLVIGYRINRTDNLYRRFMAWMLHLAGIILFGINVKDVDCGFKLFKKPVIDRIGDLKTASAITETELVTRTKRAGFTIAEVGVNHHSRDGGEQTGGKPSIVFKAAIEGFKLWWLLLNET